MHILGFDCYGHDAAAAIYRDGQMLGLVEEERFLRRKHVIDFPKHSIAWCLEIAGIKPSELDHVVYYWNPHLAIAPRAWFLLRNMPRSIGLIRSRGTKERDMSRLRQTLREESGIECGQGAGRTRLHFAEHHLCHAASAFLTSPYDKAAILSIDAAGEWDCTWMGVGEGLDMRPLRTMHFPNSVGLVYGAVTEFLGFKFASGEGKVMGLAPYGDPQRYLKLFRDVIRTGDDGQYQVDLSYFTYQYLGRPRWFSKKFHDALGPARAPDGEMTQHYMDIAAAIQARTEEVGLHLARWLRKASGLNKVCLAGGVCLNSVMNGKILLQKVFDDVMVQPAANDAGTALGACAWLWNTTMRQPRTYVFEHAYFGPWMEDTDYERAIQAALPGGTDEPGGTDKRSPRSLSVSGDGNGAPFTYHRVDDAPQLAAQMLSEGKIIGWFQGRMEMGPRALGNRSILADPRTAEMKDLLNARVKFREGFRPFAPSVLEERSAEWFETGYPSPYMILVYDVLPEKRALIPAVTHVDGTGRVQTVSRKHNPRYYRLIEEFGKITGVPVVLNTSFNIRGEPIVCSPADAYRCFMATEMDALVMENCLLLKSEQQKQDERAARKYITSFQPD
jgi:carbamoyltransferase